VGARGGRADRRGGWERIRRHVFPLLEAEAKRLDREYRRLRYGD
jgi:hypothetical protein